MKSFVVLLAGLLCSSMAWAVEFVEGTHYKALPTAPSAEPEVVEYFSYYCPGCYRFEPLANILHDNFEPSVFKRVHVDFLYYSNRETRQRLPETGEMMTRAFATAKVLNVEQQLTALVFDRHFKQQLKTKSQPQVRQMFAQVGVDGATFDKAFASFTVNAATKNMLHAVRQAGIRSVPSVVVNGRYQVDAASLADSEDFVADYLKLVNYLLTLK